MSTSMSILLVVSALVSRHVGAVVVLIAASLRPRSLAIATFSVIKRCSLQLERVPEHRH